MDAFSLDFIFQKADWFLFKSETLWFEDSSRILLPTTEFATMVKKLEGANVIALTQDALSLWKPKLICLSEVI
jgi:hypothetical protein